MKIYAKIDFSDSPNMPKGFPSESLALAAAEAMEPTMKATATETAYGWVVDVDDCDGSIGSIVQNGEIRWWCGGERCLRQMEPNWKYLH